MSFVTQPAADPDVTALAQEIFTDHVGRQQGSMRPVELGLDHGLWETLTRSGLADLTLPEDAGGCGASWLEAAALLRIAAASAAPVPLAEHDLLAGWLLAEAGLLPLAGEGDGGIDAAGSGSGCPVRVAARPDPAGDALNVAWAGEADEVVALWEEANVWKVVRVPMADLPLVPGRNGAGEPTGSVVFDLELLSSGVVVPDTVGEQFHLRGALARSIQVVGAMERVIDIVIEHVGTRVQFGRPIGRFQAVAHRVAQLASETALARTAVDAAVAHVATQGWAARGALWHVAVAKSTSWHAASEVVRGSHQLLGAIGTTQEHELGGLTLPILARRSEFGSVHEWDETLTRLAVAAGSERLWPLVLTGRSRSIDMQGDS